LQLAWAAGKLQTEKLTDRNDGDIVEFLEIEKMMVATLG